MTATLSLPPLLLKVTKGANWGVELEVVGCAGAHHGQRADCIGCES